MNLDQISKTYDVNKIYLPKKLPSKMDYQIFCQLKADLCYWNMLHNQCIKGLVGADRVEEKAYQFYLKVFKHLESLPTKKLKKKLPKSDHVMDDFDYWRDRVPYYWHIESWNFFSATFRIPKCGGYNVGEGPHFTMTLNREELQALRNTNFPRLTKGD